MDEDREAVALFYTQGPRWIAEMRRATDAGDPGALALAAREMAGAASVARAFPLEWVCEEIEIRACADNPAAASRLFPALAAAWERALTALHAELGPG
jgi:HPt (histidine-containing phosphotransfer) domain-containing protein